MDKYTVVFTQSLPLGGGTAAYHCAHEVADSTREAADKCVRSLGGYATVIVVMEGHVNFMLRGKDVYCWNLSEKYQTEQMAIQEYVSPHQTQALKPLKKRNRRGRRGRSTKGTAKKQETTSKP